MSRAAALRALPLLLLAAPLLAGCTDQCSTQGCPEGRVCSLATDNCLLPEDVYGPGCFYPSECHRSLCLDTGSPSGLGTCTGTCGPTDPACPTGFACAPVGDGQGGTLDACVPAGAGAVGERCASGADCTTGLCLPVDPAPVCSADCDPDVPADCGDGNVGCAVFQDDQGQLFGFCLAGGDAAPGDACPGGLTDCDLSQSDTCLSNADGSLSLCAPACPNGEDDCAMPGSCCVDLGDAASGPAPFCLPPSYCSCEPDCLGRACGDDGCGGSCGTCGDGESCLGGVCSACTPSCGTRECGDDGCGGACGSCAPGSVCQAGVCTTSCVPDCTDRACGDDGCGGLCGTCTQPDRCHDGACVDPALLLVDVVVRDPALSPPALWGLGEYRSEASIGPPLTYGQGPQAGTTQERICGTQIVCNESVDLVPGTTYALVLGYGAERTHCTATFVLRDGAPAEVDGGDCVASGGGPFASVGVDATAGEVRFDWRL